MLHRLRPAGLAARWCRAGLFVLGVALALGGCDPGTRPNVILVSVDCLNQRQFERALTDGSAPNLAALAGESLIFERAHSHAAWTIPSHMSMLTGLYPSQHGFDLPWRVMMRSRERLEIEPHYPTMAEILGGNGFETVGLVGQGSMSADFGLARGFQTWHESPKRAPDRSDLPRTIRRLESWLDQRAGEGGDPDRPFFLFLHTYDLHGPLSRGIGSAEEALSAIDRQLGRAVEALRRHGQWDDSLVFLTGDHGSAMVHNEDKCCVHGAGHYEENIHVPLVVRRPGGRESGRRQGLARHVDLLPTALDVVGLEGTPYTGPGVSLLDVEGRNRRVEYSLSEADGRCARRGALVTDRYKYIWTAIDETRLMRDRWPGFVDKGCPPRCRQIPPEEELFDLVEDPYEEHDLAGSDDPPVQRVLALFRSATRVYRHLEPRYDRRWIARDEAMSGELVGALRELGYIEDEPPSAGGDG